MKTVYYNVPRESRILDIPDLDVYLEKVIDNVQRFTYNYIKIVHHKFANATLAETYKAPTEFDASKNDKYHMF
jgi:hypothetical protein